MNGVDVVIFSDGMTGGGIWARTGGAYKVATHIRKTLGLRVQVIDFWSLLNQYDNELLELVIRKFVGSKTLFVGFSSTFFNLRLKQQLGYQEKNSKQGFYTRHVTNQTFVVSDERMGWLRSLIKSINPSTALVLGGAQATKSARHIDVVMFGYGEKHVEEYILWRQGKNPFFRGKRDGNLLLLDYNVTADGYDFGHSMIEWQAEDCVIQGEALPIEVSRGCIFRCKFCSFPLNGRHKLDYLKDREILRAELSRNYELYGVTKYMFSDDTYNDTTEKLEWMNDVLSTLPFKIQFGTYGRLDLIIAHPEQAQLLLDNGCTSITFGIESLNQKAAAAIGKGAKTERLIEVLYQLRELWGNRIHTTSGFILGLPHDTYDTIRQWTEQLTEPRFPLHNRLFIPLGITNIKKTHKKFTSEFDQDPEKYGYMIQPGGGWINEKFGTDSAGCEVMAKDLTNYVSAQANYHFGSHVLIGVEDEVITRERSLLLGCFGIHRKFNMLDRTHVTFLTYIGKLLNLPTD